MVAPFLILGLPRSRTFWLSKFLSYGGWHCGHDELRHMRSMDDVMRWFQQEYTGSAETAAAIWWRLIPDNVHIVTVRRPVGDVISSMLQLGLAFDKIALAKSMAAYDRKLDQLECRRGALSVRFADLNDERVAASIFEYCLNLTHDSVWWGALSPINLQTDMRAMMRYYKAYQEPLSGLANIAKQRILSALHKPKQLENTSLVIAQERFDTFYRDGASLFREHLSIIGSDPDTYADRNIPLLRAIDGIGSLQIVTARSNGRMFGYLMAEIGPSREGNYPVAIHSLSFASPAFPGLGMRLHRASVEALWNKGVKEIRFRAGVLGDGPRLSVMYRRLGAVDDGKLFVLKAA